MIRARAEAGYGRDLTKNKRILVETLGQGRLGPVTGVGVGGSVWVGARVVVRMGVC